MSESAFVRHIPCPQCGSQDNNSLYTDGHEHCFSCTHHTNATGEPSTPRRTKIAGDLLTDGVVEALPSRHISEDTCAHFKYQIGEYKGEPVQIANYFDSEGVLVGQKIRGAGKKFKVLGSLENALPFGAQAFPKTGLRVVVTEGEIDAMAMSQAQKNRYPVVSIACGAGGQIKKYMGQHRAYFTGFEEVVFLFDNDQPGRDAAALAASIIGARAKIAELPLKDAGEMLVAGRVAELLNAPWRAVPYRPEGLVEMSTLKEQVKVPPTMGKSYPWPRLTALTYGIPRRAIIAVGGATGGGKTDFLAQIIQHLTTVHHDKVGVFSLEQHIVETARRLAGKFAGKTFHIPGAGWTDEDVDTAWAGLMQGGKVFLYDSFGVNEWDAIEEKIEYLRHTEDVQYFFIDNLTALAAAEENEKEGLERIMAAMGSLVQRLDVTIFLVSHLATPEGTPHEEGGRVMTRHFKGSRSIGFWCYQILGLERDQQAEDIVARCTTAVRVLKERLTGQGVGEVSHILYDRATGMLNESDGPPKSSGGFGFSDETLPKEGSHF